MKKIGCILLMSIMTFSVWAQKENDDVRAGNKLYKASKYTEAEIAYRKGLMKNPKSFEANYNLGNTLFKQKKYPQALEQYNNALNQPTTDKKQMAAAFHNVGNSLLVDKKIEESIKAYKSALKCDPKDDETRYNLAYAQMMLKKQQQDEDKNKTKKDKDNEKADKIKNLADELVKQGRYQEAYDLMKKAEMINPQMKKYADFTNRIFEVIKLKI